MSEYFFGVQHGRLSAAELERRERVAKNHEVTFVYTDVPGDGPRSWFATRNYGEPFDSATARAVMADLETEPVTVVCRLAHAEALAQLVKRITWAAIREHAVDDSEAEDMREALEGLRRGLADSGFNPR